MKTKKRTQCTFPGCNQTFSTQGHMARHLKIHTGEKSHVCPIMDCDRRFTRKDNMLNVLIINVAFQFTQEEDTS
jgi:uncharacterized Zn-finger protein